MKAGAAAAAAVVVGPRVLAAATPRIIATPSEIFAEDLALEALNASARRRSAVRRRTRR